MKQPFFLNCESLSDQLKYIMTIINNCLKNQNTVNTHSLRNKKSFDGIETHIPI